MLVTRRDKRTVRFRMERRTKLLASCCAKKGRRTFITPHRPPDARRGSGDGACCVVAGRPRHVRGGPCEPRDSARPLKVIETCGERHGQGSSHAGPAAAVPSHRSSAAHVSHRRGPVFGRPIEPAKSAVSMGTPGLSPAPGGVCHGSPAPARCEGPSASGTAGRPPARAANLRVMEGARSVPRLARPDAPHMALRLRTPPHAPSPDPCGAVSVRRAVGRDTRRKLAPSLQLSRTRTPVTRT